MGSRNSAKPRFYWFQSKRYHLIPFSEYVEKRNWVVTAFHFHARDRPVKTKTGSAELQGHQIPLKHQHWLLILAKTTQTRTRVPASYHQLTSSVTFFSLAESTLRTPHVLLHWALMSAQNLHFWSLARFSNLELRAGWIAVQSLAFQSTTVNVVYTQG